MFMLMFMPIIGGGCTGSAGGMAMAGEPTAFAGPAVVAVVVVEATEGEDMC